VGYKEKRGNSRTAGEFPKKVQEIRQRPRKRLEQGKGIVNADQPTGGGGDLAPQRTTKREAAPAAHGEKSGGLAKQKRKKKGASQRANGPQGGKAPPPRPNEYGFLKKRTVTKKKKTIKNKRGKGSRMEVGGETGEDSLRGKGGQKCMGEKLCHNNKGLKLQGKSGYLGFRPGGDQEQGGKGRPRASMNRKPDPGQCQGNV